MRKLLFLLATLVLSLLAPRAGRADPIVLSYFVDEKALKEADAGTTVTFTLYSDASCTAQVSSFDLLIENVPFLDRVQRARPKGAPKQPKTVELRVPYGLSTLPRTLYLTVSGVGITPVAPACQAQVATANEQSHYISVYTINDVRSTSPDLEGTVLTRPNGYPAGVICVKLPVGVLVNQEGVVASIQYSGTAVYTIQASSIYNHQCNVQGLGGIQVSTNYFNGTNFVPSDVAFTLLFPGPGIVYP